MKAYNEHTYQTFKRNTVETIPLTEGLIKDVMPYFPKYIKCIGGYVDDSKQFWKSNYHWEHLCSMIRRSIEENLLDDRLTTCAKAVLANLENNPPNPITGYLAAKAMGTPKDITPRDQQISRWKTLRQSKKDFKTIITKAGIIGPGKDEKEHVSWYYCVAPVARPGTSKHGCGYALDIQGRDKKDNPLIRSVSAELGSSHIFDEASHVHVEFKNGVNGALSSRVAAANQKANKPVGDGSTSPNVSIAPPQTMESETALKMMCLIKEDPTDPEVNPINAEPTTYLQQAQEAFNSFLTAIDW
ncbi:hypothetical protein [Marivita geojedonensis]|uniref:hypothetical protein n=1 Tax=Marivita geojedonensis TaxID=1123756 RepID=UPI000D462B2E|nr:hypothetical protein [Marivita geojedonensis]PRY71230.1 hypothetical protein CLV76_1462 [Marivita geojedonensis]